MSQNDQGNNNRVERKSYVPSNNATSATGQIFALLEGLSLQERNYVLSRVRSTYLDGSKVRSGKPKKDSSVKQNAQKSPHKVAWEQSAEYKAWQDAKVPKGTTPTAEQSQQYLVLQAAAIARKKEICRFLGVPLKEGAEKDEKHSSSSQVEPEDSANTEREKEENPPPLSSGKTGKQKAVGKGNSPSTPA